MRKYALLIALIVLVGAIYSFRLRGDSSRPLPPPQVNHYRLSFSARNPSGEFLREGILEIAVPRERSSQHSRRTVVSDPRGTLRSDDLGNSTLEFMLTLPPYGTASITIEGDITFEESDDSPPSAADTAPAPFIESDAPEIQTLAHALKRDRLEESVTSFSDEIRRIVPLENYISEDLGALRALQEKRGDCTEYAALMTALLRAIGVPSRTIGGYVLNNSQNLRASNYHNWIEYYAHGRWKTFDPTAPRADVKYYLPFRVLSSNRSARLRGWQRMYASDLEIKLR